MKTDSQTRRGNSTRGQSGSRVLLTVALLVVMLSGVWLIGRDYVMRSAPESPDRYLGIVQLAPDRQGRCERLELDNRAGVMRAAGSTRCGDIVSSIPGTGSVGRLNGISDYFKAR
jgi:hypothetical protein